jgi:hypothetical protein
MLSESQDIKDAVDRVAGLLHDWRLYEIEAVDLHNPDGLYDLRGFPG